VLAKKFPPGRLMAAAGARGPADRIDIGHFPVAIGAPNASAGGTVTISTRPEGPTAVLEVADTGVGIPPDELPRIFDRFWRGQAAAQTSGSGIGLAIAAELAWAHGGTLTAASQPGAGTRLTLTLPLSSPPPLSNPPR
jgi:two-component system, OmpR family, sensor histidine kinase BaeS